MAMWKWYSLAFLFLCAFSLLYLGKIILAKQEKVVFYSQGDRLVGTLATPRFKQGPFNLMVVVHGSTPQVRDELRGFQRLTAAGHAVFTYDKRGAGESEGEHLSLMSDSNIESWLTTLAQDALAAVNTLKSRPEFSATQTGLIGGSQAGWVMPLVAKMSKHISYFVSISGPAVTFGEEDYYSRLTGDSPGFFTALSKPEIDEHMASFRGPHGYDPRLVLAGLKIPSLWLLGGEDKSVPTPLSIERLREVNKRKGLFDIQLYPDGDHSLVSTKTGERIDYWSRIYDWLSEKKNGKEVSAHTVPEN